eukprot:CAMPEP_0184492552 /NCGR_PEP_ID=MMETSP0113_2-20130426/23622_1 /TAXON_ID=91329 /ORGANISM="Norrisiella sphaerica, Strain BC52" /LENGTH=43 /DNA_ID= /DNA_START= /DNA_END= /DNA_ORIENTATION=
MREQAELDKEAAEKKQKALKITRMKSKAEERELRSKQLGGGKS